MSDEAAHRLRSARLDAGFRTAAEAALALGLAVTTYINHENGTRGFSRHAPVYAQHFGVDLEWLMTGRAGTAAGDETRATAAFLSAASADISSDLPILGTAAASIVGAVTLGRTVGYERRPPALRNVPDAYALYVAGDSMIPRYFPGDIVYVNPHRPCRQGDDVVIQTRIKPGDDISGYVKCFISRSSRGVVARQYNPETQIEYSRNTVVAVHRILTAHELMQS